MSKTVYRHLLEQRWREEGALDLLVRSDFTGFVPDGLHASRWSAYGR